MKTKRTLAWTLMLTMLMTFMPGVSFTAAAAVNDAVKLKKELIITEAGMPNELRLEAYVTGSLETSSGASPADIVLVLDQSGSMDDHVTSGGGTESKLQIM